MKGFSILLFSIAAVVLAGMWAVVTYIVPGGPSSPGAASPTSSGTASSPPIQTPYGQKYGPAYLYPDPAKTPGATNPSITQDTIKDTICNKNWSTKSIRPPATYTTNLKKQQLAAGYTFPMGDTNPADYEEDHFIGLELGGNPTSDKNLWPESYNTQVNGKTIGARQKDKVENFLHDQVCSSNVTLKEAQDKITQDWYGIYLSIIPAK